MHRRCAAKDAEAIWRAGVAAVDSSQLMTAAVRWDGTRLRICGQDFDISSIGRLIVVGAGKASGGMARGLLVSSISLSPATSDEAARAPQRWRRPASRLPAPRGPLAHRGRAQLPAGRSHYGLTLTEMNVTLLVIVAAARNEINRRM